LERDEVKRAVNAVDEPVKRTERTVNRMRTAAPTRRATAALWTVGKLVTLAGLALGLAPHRALAQNAAQRAALARLSRTRSGPAPQDAPPSGGEATTVPLDRPIGLAFDSAGNLYIADADDNVIREVSLTGVISTAAGDGEQGFGGDGGAPASALLDTPTGVAVDANGNLYIADSHNNRIREVSGGVITTIAGTGTAGFSGDGGAATSAMLAGPTAVAVDSNGKVYIADTGNHRIREITGTTIATVAGDGEQTYSGDNGPATAAGLDSPTGVAVDAAFNIYIGDTENQRVRIVSFATGDITTLAGTGVKGFSGDGTAAAAALARPSGVAVDPSSGNVYLADSDNNLIRTISAGNLTTIAGNGSQGFTGDTGASTSASLDTPLAVTALGGAVLLSDTGNNRVREVLGGVINTISGQSGSGAESLVIGSALTAVYGSGTLSATFSNNGQTGTGLVTFYDGEGANPVTIGQASLTANVATISTGMLAVGTHYIVASYAGDANNPPITSGVYVFVVTPLQLTAVANSVSLLYGQAIPALTGTLTGVLAQDAGNVTAVFSTTATITSAPGTYPITVALTGSAAANYTVVLGAGSGSVVIAQAPTVTSLTASSATFILGSPVTLTAKVASTTSGTPTGTVNFFNGAVELNSAPVALNNGVATLTVSTLPLGPLSLTAVYSGDVDFLTSTSSPLTGTVLSPDFTLAASPSAQSVLPSQSVSYTLTLTPANGTFVYPVSLSASGLPEGVTATFTPASVATGAGTSTVSMALSASSLARLEKTTRPLSRLPSSAALAFLLLPLLFGKRLRKAASRLSRAGRLLVALLALAVVGTLVGCGGGGFFGHSTRSYTVTVTAVSGPDTHTANVTLTVQ
jgi:sugar lactone lactonase YvrE